MVSIVPLKKTQKNRQDFRRQSYGKSNVVKSLGVTKKCPKCNKRNKKLRLFHFLPTEFLGQHTIFILKTAAEITSSSETCTVTDF